MSEVRGDSASMPVGDHAPLRVLRVGAGERFDVVFLTARVFGLFTHHKNNRSQYCDPDGCVWGCPKQPRNWKGYEYIWRHEKQRNIWTPWVLEISEHLERDLRGLYSRGQVWELSRARESARKHSPVCGRYLREIPENLLDAPEDVIPTLRILFHVEHLRLDQKNPMPGHTMVQARRLDLATAAEEADVEKPVPDGWQGFQAEARRRQQRKPE